MAAIFCVWDRWFGTFQEELEEEPPVYGVLKPVHTWNPLIINYQHMWGMIQDAWNTRSWKDKLTLWWRPTGYRPDDVALEYPKTKISTKSSFEKYNPVMSSFKKTWAMFQWLCITVMLFFLLSNYESFSSSQALLTGGLIMISIFGFTSLMDGYVWSYNFELGRNFLGLLFFAYLIKVSFIYPIFPVCSILESSTFH